MRRTALFSLPVAAIIGVSCSSSSTTPAATPAPAAQPAAAAPTAGRGAAAPAAAAPQAAGRGAAAPTAAAGAPAGAGAAAQAAGGRGAGAGGGAQGGRGGGPQQTAEQRAARRDSISQARAATVRELMATIAGRENEPAGTVFKNVQLMKTVPAGQFLTAMDQGIGRALSRGCNECHLTTDWASDSIPRKNTARTMMGIVNDINTTLLPKMGPGRGGQPRSIQCVTCHRGGAAGSTALVP